MADEWTVQVDVNVAAPHAALLRVARVGHRLKTDKTQ